MTRTINSATLAELTSPTIYPVWICRLDVANDPVYVHTGLGNLTFASGMGYDSALVGYTFIGSGNIFKIDVITDSQDGSQTLNLSLPGVQLGDDYLNQIINNGDLWQGNEAYLWFATFDQFGNLVGAPIRVKSARMDQMTMEIDPGNSQGTLTVSLESQAAYNSEANQNRYNQQTQIDSTDTSMIYIYALANAVANIGVANSAAQTKAINSNIVLNQINGFL